MHSPPLSLSLSLSIVWKVFQLQPAAVENILKTHLFENSICFNAIQHDSRYYRVDLKHFKVLNVLGVSSLVGWDEGSYRPKW